MIGIRELVLIAMVAAALYGRSGVLKSDRAKTVLPWISPVRRGGRKPPPRRPMGANLIRGDRLFWAMALIATSAVIAWIVTRTLIASGPH